MSNIDSSGPHHAHETSMVSAKQASSADTESEAGSIAKNMGSVINSWSDKLNSALQGWNDINQEIQQQETRIQLEVMYDFTGIQTNQKTLAGILSTLKQMANAAINNIQ